MVVALINMPEYTGTFEEIAAYVEKRNLFPERKGGIELAKQMDLRALKVKAGISIFLRMWERGRLNNT